MAETTQVQGMGSNGRVQLGNEMQLAMTDCKAYIAKVRSSIETMQKKYNDLQGGFEGRAANGFNEFYKKVVDEFFKEGGTFDKYMNMYADEEEGLFACIEKTFVGEPSGIDPNLAEQNKQMSGGGTNAQ